MRKNFGSKPYLYPMPVMILAAYGEDGTPNAMNAAWGCISDKRYVALSVAPKHKTVDNILFSKAFTVSIADATHLVEADYLGIVSGHSVPDKVSRAGLTTMKSTFVNAPLIVELPMALECQLVSYDPASDLLIGEIINVCAEEQILDDSGKIDPKKLNPISYDPVHNDYLLLGEKIGNAFMDGAKLKG